MSAKDSKHRRAKAKLASAIKDGNKDAYFAKKVVSDDQQQSTQLQENQTSLIQLTQPSITHHNLSQNLSTLALLGKSHTLMINSNNYDVTKNGKNGNSFIIKSS